MDYHSSDGECLGQIFAVEGDRDRVGNVLRKIVRGLFYQEKGFPMPHDVRWTFESVSSLQSPCTTGDPGGSP
jgi:hypothetical protein